MSRNSHESHVRVREIKKTYMRPAHYYKTVLYSCNRALFIHFEPTRLWCLNTAMKIMSDWSVCYFKRALYSCERARSVHIETKQLYYSYESHVRLICILLGKSPIFIRKKPIFIRKERALYLHERSQYSYEKKEPYIHTKEAYIHTKEPYAHISCKTHPCITTASELYISAKEPYTYILNQIDFNADGQSWTSCQTDLHVTAKEPLYSCGRALYYSERVLCVHNEPNRNGYTDTVMNLRSDWKV